MKTVEELQAELDAKQKAYDEYKDSHHKLKENARKMQEELEAIKEQKRIEEEEKAKERGDWQKLANEREEVIKKLKEENQKVTQKTLKLTKRQAVIAKLGGLLNDQYATFIKDENVLINEFGQVDEKSLEAECDRFRQEHGSLIKQSTSKIADNSAAAKTGEAPVKSYNDLSPAEKAELRRKALTGN